MKDIDISKAETSDSEIDPPEFFALRRRRRDITKEEADFLEASHFLQGSQTIEEAAERLKKLEELKREKSGIPGSDVLSE